MTASWQNRIVYTKHGPTGRSSHLGGGEGRPRPEPWRVRCCVRGRALSARSSNRCRWVYYTIDFRRKIQLNSDKPLISLFFLMRSQMTACYCHVPSEGHLITTTQMGKQVLSCWSEILAPMRWQSLNSLDSIGQRLAEDVGVSASDVFHHTTVHALGRDAKKKGARTVAPFACFIQRSAYSAAIPPFSALYAAASVSSARL